MKQLNYQKRIHLHTAVDAKTSTQVLRFHTLTNWITRSRVGFNVGYAQTFDDECSPRQFGLTLALASTETHAIGSHESVGPLRAHSVREFHDRAPIEFLKITRLLQHSFGVRNADDNGRPYASAGGLYPINVMLMLLSECITNVPDTLGTVCHFEPLNQQLTKLNSISREVLASTLLDCASQDASLSGYPIKNPAFAILYTLHIDSAIIKYRHRGYRFALLEAGAMAHQADLVGCALGFRSCNFGGFGDNEVAVLCGLNPGVMLPVHVQFFGYPLAEGSLS